MHRWLLNSSPVVWSVRIQTIHVGPCTYGSEVSEAASLCSKAVLTARAEGGSVLVCEMWAVQKAKQLSDMQEEEEEDPVKGLLSDKNHHNVFFRGIFICWLWKGFLLQWFLILRNLSHRNGEMALHWLFSTTARTQLLCSWRCAELENTE